MGLDALHGIQIAIDMDNANGGLLIGGQRYNIQLIYYDSKNDQATAAAAVNRLVFVDGVKFIMSGLEYVDSYVPITEANKVILLSQPNTPVILSPNKHYAFDGAIAFENIVSSYGWLQGYAGAAGKKTVGLTATDDLSGHGLIATEQQTLPVFGFQPIGDPIYYPATATDLSSVGLKIASLNPDIWNIIGGAGSPLAIKYVYQAGYKGLKFSWACAGASLFNAFAGTDATEGVVGGAYPVEFDPATTPIAQAYKTAFIAKFGGYHGEELQDEIEYEILRAALMQAGSLDTDKVAGRHRLTALSGRAHAVQARWSPGRISGNPRLSAQLSGIPSR